MAVVVATTAGLVKYPSGLDDWLIGPGIGSQTDVTPPILEIREVEMVTNILRGAGLLLKILAVVLVERPFARYSLISRCDGSAVPGTRHVLNFVG